jgi:hypothetical protein
MQYVCTCDARRSSIKSDADELHERDRFEHRSAARAAMMQSVHNSCMAEIHNSATLDSRSIRAFAASKNDLHRERTMKLTPATWFAALSAALVVSVPTHASSLTITSTVINGTPPSACTTNATTTPTTFCADNYGFAADAGTINNVTAGPTPYNIGNTFNPGGSPQTTADDFGAQVYTPSTSSKCPSSPNCVNSSSPLSWNFQDNYEFLTPGSGPTVQGAVVSFTVGNGNGNIGLGSLEARIVTAGDTSAPGTVAATANTVVDGWQNVTLQSGSLTTYTATLNSNALNGNTDYILEIRGEAASAAGYGGSVTFAPVPLPASAWLLISALCALLAITYRDRIGVVFSGLSAAATVRIA